MARSRTAKSAASARATKAHPTDTIWAYLVHVSYNMWDDRSGPERTPPQPYTAAQPYLRCDTSTWNELLDRLARAGANMVLMDLGDAVRYQSHPEIAVRGAWSPKRLKRELAKARSMGIEPIPKLNFATTHDVWLGPYARCVSTDAYYRVCKDIIAEVIDLFDGPRFFHLGMDEESAFHQRFCEYVVVRQYDLWWHDALFLVDQVERGGVRAWIWSDYLWSRPEAFFDRMPASVLQTNWHYGKSFSRKIGSVRAYLDLDAHGYDQVACGSSSHEPGNFLGTTRFCRRSIDPKRLLGFMQTPWRPTLPEFMDDHAASIAQLAEARAKWPE